MRRAGLCLVYGMRRDAVTTDMLRLMGPEDRARYSPAGLPAPAPVTPPPAKNRTTRAERIHQGTFANHCLRKGYAFTWHRTDKPSTASPGTPDFIVGVRARTFWIEFKLPGEKLSPDQADFRNRLAAQGIALEVVYSDAEAIALVDPAPPDVSLPSTGG
jgi:hypothetical protein